MREEEVPPGPQLMESMRAVGYTLESAIADLIDNSISANAENVRIHFGSLAEDFVSIVDDGDGMSFTEAREAMKLAATNARENRSGKDLGRFGLGLKTASLSQCRDLTLVSKKKETLVGVRWSLDHLARTGRWSLLVLNETEMADLPDIGLLTDEDSGTLVLWREIDQLAETLGGSPRALDEQMVGVRDHLQLVFHRYLAGEHGQPLSIWVNSVKLRQIDPFLSAHPSTQIGPVETFDVGGETIRLRPYTLPLVSKMSSVDRDKALVAGTLRDSQGFYIYRAMRLVIWGTWFRIATKDELGKLARVKVDIPNSLDHLWALDIKKSAAVPPPVIRNELRRIATKIVAPSRSVHLFRGRVDPSFEKVTRTWNLVRDRNGFRYEINREHPVIAELSSLLDAQANQMFGAAISLFEDSFPIEDLHNRLGQDEIHSVDNHDESKIFTLATALWVANAANGGTAEEFVERLSYVEPFSCVAHPLALLKRATEELLT